MKEIKIKIINKNEMGLPKYAKEGDSGIDLFANESMYIGTNDTRLIKTGIFVEIPKGYELQIRSRSGLAYRKNIFVLNSPGTIDSTYRGEIGVILHNVGVNSIQIKKGDKIAQAILCPVYKIKWEKVDKLEESNRGEDGFGSTGV